MKKIKIYRKGIDIPIEIVDCSDDRNILEYTKDINTIFEKPEICMILVDNSTISIRPEIIDCIEVIEENEDGTTNGYEEKMQKEQIEYISD